MYVRVRWDTERETWVGTAASQDRRNLGRYGSAKAAAVAVARSGGYPDSCAPRGVLGGFARTVDQLATRDAACQAIGRALQVQASAGSGIALALLAVDPQLESSPVLPPLLGRALLTCAARHRLNIWYKLPLAP